MNLRFFDQNDSEFARMEMEVFPRNGDTVEIGFPDQPLKHFWVERVTWKMVKLPGSSDPPWRWDIHLSGMLFDPETGESASFSKDTKTPA